jgi:HAD superfamily hydrolase (TIGR01450 family)
MTAITVQPRFSTWWKKQADAYDGILFDIDGTLISGRHPLPGAAALIAHLRAAGFPFLLLTNDGNHSPEEKSRTLAKAGLDLGPADIVSCGHALTPFVAQHGLAGQRFYAMGDLGVPDYAALAGLVPVREPREINGCAGVIVGEGVYNWQDNIGAALNFFIGHPDRPLLVPNPDSYWPNGPNGEIGVGAGGKARFLCQILRDYGIRKSPVYLGKPYPAIFRLACRRLHERAPGRGRLHPGRILMIGDSLASDIKGANRAGLVSALVLTGITTPSHLRAVKPACRPRWIFRTLG